MDPFDIFSDKYAWTPAGHKNNTFSVGHFTPLDADGIPERNHFDASCKHELFKQWVNDDRMPLGSYVKYSSLCPVLLYDFGRKRNKSTCPFVRYKDLCDPVDEDGYIVYNGMHNSGRDPRHFASPDITQKDLNDLYRGCQAQAASCRHLTPSRDDFAHKVVVYAERINKRGGVLIKDHGPTALVSKINSKFLWNIRLEPQVNRTRSEDFPYAQIASCVWFRESMGNVELNARRVCRDLELELKS